MKNIEKAIEKKTSVTGTECLVHMAHQGFRFPGPKTSVPATEVRLTLPNFRSFPKLWRNLPERNFSSANQTSRLPKLKTLVSETKNFGETYMNRNFFSPCIDLIFVNCNHSSFQ